MQEIRYKGHVLVLIGVSSTVISGTSGHPLADADARGDTWPSTCMDTRYGNPLVWRA